MLSFQKFAILKQILNHCIWSSFGRYLVGYKLSHSWERRLFYCTRLPAAFFFIAVLSFTDSYLHVPVTEVQEYYAASFAS